MKPKPWSKRWERPKFNVKGIRFDLCLTEEQMKEAQKWSQPWLEFYMMKLKHRKIPDLRVGLVTGRGYTDSQRPYLETSLISYIRT